MATSKLFRMAQQGGIKRRSSDRRRSGELSAALSASLRTELLHEIQSLSTPDDAALWAHRKLPAKNQLPEADAQQVEEAFAAQLAMIQVQNAKSDDVLSAQSLAEQTSAGTEINKAVLVFPEPRRIRDRDHIRHVIKQPCLVCGRKPCDPHHLRFAQSRALGRKVSDEFTVPLCRGHHQSSTLCGRTYSFHRFALTDIRLSKAREHQEGSLSNCAAEAAAISLSNCAAEAAAISVL
jgi:hypothetical protein